MQSMQREGVMGERDGAGHTGKGGTTDAARGSPIRLASSVS